MKEGGREEEKRNGSRRGEGKSTIKGIGVHRSGYRGRNGGKGGGEERAEGKVKRE